MKTKLLMQLAIGCLGAAQGYAGQIYQLVDYPDLQNGYSLSGTIEVSEHAATDGMLLAEEITDWFWLADGPATYSGRLQATDQPTRAVGIEIDSRGIYLSNANDVRFVLEDAFEPRELRTLVWLGTNNGTTDYFLTGFREGDIGFDAWDSRFTRDPPERRWLIARAIPEPSSMLAAALAAYSWLAGNILRHQ